MTLQSNLAPRFAVVLSVCGSLAYAGCGDDTNAGGSGGGGDTTTVATSASVTKAASTTQGVTVNVSSSSGGPQGAPDGAACTTDAECAGGTCLTEAMNGIPAGQCTENCTDDGACDNPDSVCIGFGQTGFCLRPCDPAMPGSCGMPATLSCLELSDGSGACLGACDMDAQCTGGRVCDEVIAQNCVDQEVCNNMANDNISNEVDCEDGTCLTDAGCMTAIAGACDMPPALVIGANMGDTTMGTAVLSASCSGFGGAREIVYTFTPAMSGVYTFHLDTATDQGIYIRETCGDVTTETACFDVAFPGSGTNPAEDGFVDLMAGTTYTVVVDGFNGPMENAPFTLNVATRGCGDLACDAFPEDAVDGISECDTCPADATGCGFVPTCGFCVANGQCDQNEACTCADCDTNDFCTDPTNCTNDGFCEQFIEGCQCADCAAVPNCID